MPIKRIAESVRSAFPTIGDLRKGAPKSDKGIGDDLDHFRFASDRPEVAKAFRDAYGDEPRLLEVYLPHPTIDEDWESWQEEHVQGGLVHRCDGEVMVLWRTTDGRLSPAPKPCPYFTGEKQRHSDKDGCVPVGRLTLILPELWRRGFIGYVTLHTGSLNDIANITASLKDAAKRRQGDPLGLEGILWTLRREYRKISTPRKDGKRVRVGKWLVQIEPSPEWVLLELAAARAKTLGLPAGSAMGGSETVDQETGEIRTSDDDEDDIVDSTATEVNNGDEAAPCDPPAFLDDERKRTAVASYLHTHRVPDSEIPPLVKAWRRRCLDRDAIFAEANKIIAAAKPANGNDKTTAAQPAGEPQPQSQPITSPASAGGDSGTPDSIPPSSKPAAAVDPTPPAQDAPTEPPIDAEWADEIRGMFIDAGIPVAIRTRAMRQWADAGSTRTEAVTLFRKLVRDYKRDPDATLDVWNRQAGTTALQPQPAPEPAPESEPF